MAPAHIPLTRIVAVELRKSFDTRSGFWLLASIGIASLLATGGVILWAARDQLTYSTFTLAIGFPMAIILPLIAILSVTAEWSQRTGLTTFTLVPHRGRVIFAKAIVAISIAVASMLLAFVIGALGNLLAAALAGRDAVWDQGVATLAAIVLGNTLVVLHRLHARGADPQLHGRHRRLLRLRVRGPTAAGAARRQPGLVPRPARLGRPQRHPAAAVPRTAGRPAVAPARRHHSRLAGRALLVGLWTLQRSEVK